MLRDMEQSRSPTGSDVIMSKLRERLKEKEKALEVQLTHLPQPTPTPTPTQVHLSRSTDKLCVDVCVGCAG